MNMGFRITGKAVRIHISSRMARELQIYLTMYPLWFLESQRVLPQLRFHLPLHHPHQWSQNRPTVIQYRETDFEAPVSERNTGMNEELRGDPFHESTETENENKNRESEEVQRDFSHELL